MTAASIQAAIARGMGKGANAIGFPNDVFRATGPINPLDPANRLRTINAKFNAKDQTFVKPPSPGKNAEWWGLFDTTDIQPGDHLVGADGRWIVGSLSMVYPEVFHAPRTVTVWTAPLGASSGDGGYGGTNNTNPVALLTDWPAAILTGGRGDKSSSQDLPGDVYMGGWSMYLSLASGVTIDTTHIVTDDLGRTYIISSAELTDYWRIIMMQQKD